MSEPFTPSRIHVVVGTPWDDAVISRLEPSSPYQPWPEVPDARPGDGIVLIIDSDPRLVLPDVMLLDSIGAVSGAIASSSAWFSPAEPVSQVGCGVDALDERSTLFKGPEAAALFAALDRFGFECDDSLLFGDTSMAQAAVLLESRGRCSGCDKALELHGPDARVDVGIWTVDELRYEAPRVEPESIEVDDEFDSRRLPALPVDWPAALCIACQAAIRDGYFDTFLDYRFSRHPACPRCGERRSQRALFGMLPFDVRIEPWRDARGCCVTADNWTCARCGHRW
ncbi:hypothetical protein MycrhN_0883 [Mycolicibacterium rhodesiae NBB3]|uniref:Uncharacterized protein n=1 Tax=Mycolicibacterium rhodesiae (strain NBB3) TaxID=710685 RepID=G8RRS2_MYCRN|nr:hypothetical protein [Mycolicibacterium rhodesiae]AEV71513.1 hypothetical protein MycrhN_0883 [Mycolicibacterium rhodesiae NBB3]